MELSNIGNFLKERGEMNKVDKLLEDIDKYRQKKEEQIKKIQRKCAHKNTERWSDSHDRTVKCLDCSYYLR